MYQYKSRHFFYPSSWLTSFLLYIDPLPAHGRSAPFLLEVIADGQPRLATTDDDRFCKFRHFEILSLRQVLNGRLRASE
jgi:hypothetical protein